MVQTTQTLAIEERKARRLEILHNAAMAVRVATDHLSSHDCHNDTEESMLMELADKIDEYAKNEIRVDEFDPNKILIVTPLGVI